MTKIFTVKITDDNVAENFQKWCKEKGSTVNNELSKFIKEESGNKKEYFKSGELGFVYNRIEDNFSLNAYLDNGEKIVLLKNLSYDFLEKMEKESQKSLKERKEWISKSGKKSVAIPTKFLEEEK